MDTTIARSRKFEIRGGTLRSVAGGTSIVVGTDAVTVGRHASCGLVLDDPLVSAVHADFVATAEGVRLRDRGSRNGTFVAGARIVEAFLLERCRIQVGETPLEFEPSLPQQFDLVPTLGFGKLVGICPAMQRVFERLARCAPTELGVLLLGETGTGKELAARAIHEASPRRRGPFVVVDCGSIPPPLAEAYLFGHEAGAFTGAVERKVSPFVQASGGTIFLDELGELPLELQPKLLRAIGERRIKPVGSSKWYEIDVRILAATQRDLPREVNEGVFRSDLWFRVAELVIELPALRDRIEDVPLLVRTILESLGDAEAYGRVSTETLERLMRRSWPGNIRELRSAVMVAHALADGGSIDIAAHGGDGAGSGIDLFVSTTENYHQAKRAALERFEREYFSSLASATKGTIVEMARIAGLERAHVRRYLRRHELLPKRRTK